MGFVKIVLWVVGILLVIIVVSRVFSGNQQSDNIFNRGSSASKGFIECCTRGVKKMFGGGA